MPVSQPVESDISQLSSHKSRGSEQRDLILLNTDEPDSDPPAIIEKESIPLDYTQGGTGNPSTLSLTLTPQVVSLSSLVTGEETVVIQPDNRVGKIHPFISMSTFDNTLPRVSHGSCQHSEHMSLIASTLFLPYLEECIVGNVAFFFDRN